MSNTPRNFLSLSHSDLLRKCLAPQHERAQPSLQPAFTCWSSEKRWSLSHPSRISGSRGDIPLENTRVPCGVANSHTICSVEVSCIRTDFRKPLTGWQWTSVAYPQTWNFIFFFQTDNSPFRNNDKLKTISFLNQDVGLLVLLMFKYSVALPSGILSPVFIWKKKKSEGDRYLSKEFFFVQVNSFGNPQGFKMFFCCFYFCFLGREYQDRHL